MWTYFNHLLPKGDWLQVKRFRSKNLETSVQTMWDQQEKDLSGQLLCVHLALFHLLWEPHLFSLGEPNPTPRPWLHVASVGLWPRLNASDLLFPESKSWALWQRREMVEVAPCSSVWDLAYSPLSPEIHLLWLVNSSLELLVGHYLYPCGSQCWQHTHPPKPPLCTLH